MTWVIMQQLAELRTNIFYLIEIIEPCLKFAWLFLLWYNRGMKNSQYVLPPESIVDIAFQYNKVNYNLHINTVSGIISLEHAQNHDKKENPIFIKTIT